MSEKLRSKIRKIIKEYYDYYPDFFDPLANKNIHGFIGRKDPNGIGQTELSEEVIGEGIKNFIDIPPYMGLIGGSAGFRRISLSLFDFREKKCVGYISMSELSDRAYNLATITAEQGFGPLMAEIGMMGVYNKGICIDRTGGDTKPKVWNMLKIFADSRGDVTKTKIIPGDMEYEGKYINDYNDENKDYVANIIFFRSPSVWYKKLLDRGERLLSETNLTPIEIESKCKAYFDSRKNEV